MNSKFDLDLRDGEAREDAFAYVLLRARVEHKRDYKCVETGNVAIEYSQRSRDGQIRKSGIAVSEADWYALEYAEDCRLVLPLEAVKELTRQAIKDQRAKWVGDGNNALCALVPFEWFRNPHAAHANPLEIAA